MAKVLLIDDSDQMRMCVRVLLENDDHEVIEANGGRCGLETCRREKPDVVVMDLFMPDGDGMETLRELRSFEPRPRTVVMTGGSPIVGETERLLKMARLLGADAVLMKPFRRTELMDILAELTARQAPAQ